MLQFYFLSVLLNAIIGCLFTFASAEETINDEGEKRLPFFDKSLLLIIGLLSFVTGFFKLLSPIRGDVAVIGDVLPAFAGLLGGFCLLFDYYASVTTVSFSLNEKLEALIVTGRKYVGIGILCVGILHFLFPTVLFL